MKKTYIFTNENGTFISFLQYENEENFEDFLKFICKKLELRLPETIVGPYSRFAEIEYKGKPITLSYNGDAGCYLLIPNGNNTSADSIVRKCYGFFV